MVNIGAGTGNYEPGDRHVVALEPSLQMIGQRGERPGFPVQGEAEALPFADGAFEVALAVLTVHHWTDPVAGLREMARVAPRQVVVYFEPAQTRRFWAHEYFPASGGLPTTQDPPDAAMLQKHLEVNEIRTVLVPQDCVDGFGVAYWARPEALLDPGIQQGMSWLAMLPEAERVQGSAQLRADLESGAWDHRHGHLRTEPAYDGGYRIALAGGEQQLGDG